MKQRNVLKPCNDANKLLAEPSKKKQVRFRMPNAPKPKKGKGKGKTKSRKVPAVSLPQWELQRAHDITDSNDGMWPSLLITPGSSKENDPPARSPPRKKNRKTVSPDVAFTGLAPADVVDVDVVTSTTTASFERSACESDIERDFIESGEGSENEEDLVDITLTPRNVDAYSAASLADPSLAEAIRTTEAEADFAIRAILEPEPVEGLLSFDWRREPENFEGVKEVFTVPSTGPTFDNLELTPLEVFLKVWDADVLDHIVRETNRYGDEISRLNKNPMSRLKQWKAVTDVDIKTYFAIILMQSLVIDNSFQEFPLEEYWYPKLEELRIGNFGAIMPFNRFLAIRRCLHFVDNSSLPENPSRLDKIMPIIEHLNKKFCSLYVLEQNIVIDESLLSWKRRQLFSETIATKNSLHNIKSYELCESRTGYLWRMEVFSGKEHGHDAQVESQELVEGHEVRGETETAAFRKVLTLMSPLLNRGHTLVMNQSYNAPLLSRILKLRHKTDSMGTLGLTREFIPKDLQHSANVFDMKSGNMAFSATKDLSVVVWCDKNVAAMISTFHQIGEVEKYESGKCKPQVILDYNYSMGVIRHKNKTLLDHPLENVTNIAWYKRLFLRLLNVSIHNSFIMFNHNRTQVIEPREFRLQLTKELLQMVRPGPPAPSAISQIHLAVKNERRQRCKLCSAAKVRRSTMWRCSICAVNLCIEGCYTKYHN